MSAKSKRHEIRTCPYCSHVGRPLRAQSRISSKSVLVCPSCRGDATHCPPGLSMVERLTRDELRR